MLKQIEMIMGAKKILDECTNVRKGENVLIIVDTGVPLSQQVAGWATPTSRDGRSEIGSPEMMRRRQDRSQGKPLSKQVLGTTASPSPAGALNPEFSLWLMGFPSEWLSCAPSATQSSRKSRRSS